MVGGDLSNVQSARHCYACITVGLHWNGTSQITLSASVGDAKGYFDNTISENWNRQPSCSNYLERPTARLTLHCYTRTISICDKETFLRTGFHELIGCIGLQVAAHLRTSRTIAPMILRRCVAGRVGAATAKRFLLTGLLEHVWPSSYHNDRRKTLYIYLQRFF